MFPEAIGGIFGNFGKRVVGPVEDGVLAEHGHVDRVTKCLAFGRILFWAIIIFSIIAQQLNGAGGVIVDKLTVVGGLRYEGVMSMDVAAFQVALDARVQLAALLEAPAVGTVVTSLISGSAMEMQQG